MKTINDDKQEKIIDSLISCISNTEDYCFYVCELRDACFHCPLVSLRNNINFVIDELEDEEE